ncbi:MAG: RnfABCDGE type electron transport complex subunit G [Bacteroidales bacterium]|nr:RnfABCDGE type electron transport complex subunit G [Bacteroidales bacterium]
MAKRESNFKNMFVTLFLVTLASSAALGFIYELTKKPINDALIYKKTLAVHIVLPEFDNDPFENVKRVPVGNDTLSVYKGSMNGEITGVAVETSSPGYGGDIRMLIGFLPDGTIREVAVLEHKETAGLGDKILKSKSDFPVQFEGKNPEHFRLAVSKDGNGDVDAITASTISSRAYCAALKKAYDAFKKSDIK